MAFAPQVDLGRTLEVVGGWVISLARIAKNSRRERVQAWRVALEGLGSHPVLNYMHPQRCPEPKFEYLDYYSRLVPGNNWHAILKKVDYLTMDKGNEARIMILLLWIISKICQSKGLRYDRIILSAIREGCNNCPHDAKDIDFEPVAKALSRLFKAELPQKIKDALNGLPLSTARITRIEGQGILKERFCKYNLVAHDLDIAEHPTTLLRRHNTEGSPMTVFFPKDEGAERAMRWLLYKLGLGKALGPKSFVENDDILSKAVWLAFFPDHEEFE